MPRSTKFQMIIDHVTEDLDISQDYQDASNHPGSCRCEKCLDWWIQMGDDAVFGPFSEEEIWWAKKQKEGK